MLYCASNKSKVSTNIAENARIFHTLMCPSRHDQIWQKKIDIPIDTINVYIIYLAAEG